MGIHNIKERVLENKVLSAILIFLGIFSLGLGFFTLSLFGAGLGSHSSQASLDSYEAGHRAYDSSAGGLPEETKQTTANSGGFVEVQEAGFEIDSKNSKEDKEQLNSILNNYDGYTEESRKTETNSYREYDLTVRVPSENFEDFTSEIRNNFKVEDYHLSNYRVPIQRETDELKTLNKTMKEYDQIRKEIQQVESKRKRIDLLMQLTEKEVEIQRMMKRYQRGLSDKEKRSEMTKIEISIREEKNPQIIPEDIGHNFKSELGESLEDSVEIMIKTFTGGIEMFFKGFQYLVYIAIITIPALIGYKLVRRAYKRLF